MCLNFIHSICYLSMSILERAKGFWIKLPLKKIIILDFNKLHVYILGFNNQLYYCNIIISLFSLPLRAILCDPISVLVWIYNIILI